MQCTVRARTPCADVASIPHSRILQTKLNCIVHKLNHSALKNKCDPWYVTAQDIRNPTCVDLVPSIWNMIKYGLIEKYKLNAENTLLGKKFLKLGIRETIVSVCESFSYARHNDGYIFLNNSWLGGPIWKIPKLANSWKGRLWGNIPDVYIFNVLHHQNRPVLTSGAVTFTTTDYYPTLDDTHECEFETFTIHLSRIDVHVYQTNAAI